MGLFGYSLKAPVVIQFLNKMPSVSNILLRWLSQLSQLYNDEISSVEFHDFSKKMVWTLDTRKDLDDFISNEMDWVKSIFIHFHGQEDIAWMFTIYEKPVPYIYGDCFSEILVRKKKTEYLGNDEDKIISSLVTEKLSDSKIEVLILRDPTKLNSKWCYGSKADIYLYQKIENYNWVSSIPATFLINDLKKILDTDPNILSLSKEETFELVKSCDSILIDTLGKKGLQSKLGDSITVRKWVSL